MKNSKLVSIVLIVIISLSVMMISKDVFAAENILLDITNSSSGSNTSTGSSVSNTSSSGNTTNTTNRTTNTTNTSSTNVLTTGNTTSTTSSYNNTSLPSTGIEDSIPGAILVVVLGISAVYAYNKIRYYRDI